MTSPEGWSFFLNPGLKMEKTEEPALIIHLEKIAIFQLSVE
ncbi:hypothetical protein V7201_22805 [Bacillus sp. JJ1122]